MLLFLAINSSAFVAGCQASPPVAMVGSYGLQPLAHGTLNLELLLMELCLKMHACCLWPPSAVACSDGFHFSLSARFLAISRSEISANHTFAPSLRPSQAPTKRRSNPQRPNAMVAQGRSGSSQILAVKFSPIINYAACGPHLQSPAHMGTTSASLLTYPIFQAA